MAAIGPSGTGTVRGGGWLTVPRHRDGAAVRLYCLPWAGSGASAYRPWARTFPASVEVVPVALPGRERRLREEPLRTVDALADALVPVLRADIDRPYALFGHSMGALIAFEAALRLTRDGLPPARLFVSGSRAPHRPLHYGGLHTLAPGPFLEAVRRFQPEPGGALDDDELAELFLPTLHVDFAAAETYRRPSDTRVACPVSAFGGDADPLVDAADVAAWRLHTSGPFTSYSIEGGHLFVTTRERRMCELVGGELCDLPAGVPRTRS
ncbi:thioesterase II family protein [Streptomyces sp. NBC_01006]|uniref:thioesterase II family protein n=1 Tax=Streptomyces sp. NBC_01006 TaxID=2903716 RepID=UPI00386754BF|nr:alpha/beta fold hydrolase [Streptomyces sp. NBC_01006]